MKTVVSIPSDVCNSLEGLMYEVNARKDTIAFMAERGMIGTEQFEAYHREYLDYYRKYERAKENFSKTYIAANHPNCKWTVNFAECCVEIEEADA